MQPLHGACRKWLVRLVLLPPIGEIPPGIDLRPSRYIPVSKWRPKWEVLVSSCPTLSLELASLISERAAVGSLSNKSRVGWPLQPDESSRAGG